MYMFPMSSDIYAAVPSRVWWAPWRWSLCVYWFQSRGAAVSFTEDEIIATNISKAECIGLMKTLGYEEEIT
jgi:hypothetical protein